MRAAPLLCLTFAFALALPACEAESTLEGRACPPDNAELTYESFGRAFIERNCQTCHGQRSEDRRGAPSGYDFGSLEDVRRWDDRIFARAAAGNTTMPPGPDDPPRADRERLADWLACGAP